jgi:hypothetical protein
VTHLFTLSLSVGVVYIVQSSVFSVMFCKSLFGFFPFLLSILLRFTASYYVFALLIYMSNNIDDVLCHVDLSNNIDDVLCHVDLSNNIDDVLCHVDYEEIK